MTPGYYNQPPYPFAAPPAQPPKPHRPWPLAAVNRWMTLGVIALTLLTILLAVLAPVVASKPSIAGSQLSYQSSLTQNDGSWDENENCTFSRSGYTVTAPDAEHTAYCQLHGKSFQNFTLRIRLVEANQVAVIGFLRADRLAIFGNGRFLFYQQENTSVSPRYLIPANNPAGAGSAALHPSSLGISERTNEITIQVQGVTYAFYANGQSLATYRSPIQEVPGPITLIALGGQQATFSNIAIYTTS